MPTIGSLAVNVVAETGSFGPKIRGARQELGLFGSVADKVGHQLMHLATGFVAGFTIHRLISDVERATEQLIELGHAATRLGAGSEGLAGLVHAGAIFHVSNEELIRDLTFMEKNLGKNADAFDKLGLSVRELKGLKADETFLKIAEAINKLPTSADKAGAATAIFGKGGAGILNLIGQGKEGIAAAMAEAKRLGLAPSEEDLKKIEAEDKAIQRLKESYRGLATQAAVYFSGFATHMAGATAELLGADTPPQQAWDKYVNSLSPAKFKELIKQNPRDEWSAILDYEYRGSLADRWIAETLGGSQVHRHESIRRRYEAEQAAARQARADARSGKTIWDAGSSLVGGMYDQAAGFAGRFGQGVKNYGSIFQFAPQNFWDKMLATGGTDNGFQERWDRLGGGMSSEQKTIANLIDQMSRPWLDHPEPTKEMYGGRGVQGWSALEAGSVEAFRQERRSTLAGANGIPKLQLEEAKKQTTQLHNIDLNLQKSQAADRFELVNIA